VSGRGRRTSFTRTSGGHGVARGRSAQAEETMNIFYIIGVVVVVIAILSFLGLR
jgi:hypothetical protein